jgi:hypothetical protein
MMVVAYWEGDAVTEVIQIGAEKFDGLASGQSSCRLLSKLHFVMPTGKKDKSNVSPFITLSNVTSVLGEEISEEISEAGIDSNSHGRR